MHRSGQWDAGGGGGLDSSSLKDYILDSPLDEDPNDVPIGCGAKRSLRACHRLNHSPVKQVGCLQDAISFDLIAYTRRLLGGSKTK